jgi:outer membrane protein assembly factor BamB
MNRITRRCVAVALLLTPLSLASQSHAQRSDLSQYGPSQYGHLSKWKTEATVSPETGFELAWKANVGEGRSQVVVDGDRLFVLAGESEKRADKKPPLCKTRLLCLDRSSGNEIWKRESESQDRLEGQESFSGATLCPRATPMILGNQIVTVSYTGILECVNKDNGDLKWKKNLVDLGATPVQFGFSSSSVCNGSDVDRFFVTAAGPEGGLYCLAAEDGETIWKSECGSFSYATPTFATFDGVKQILVITRDEILGTAEIDGKQLWKLDLREKGLTNVPSPLVLEDGFVHSSQGSKGTSRVVVSRVNDKWEATEKWYSRRAQFFYSNWTTVNTTVQGSPNLIIGVADKLLVAIDIDDGSIVGRWRGFADGNLAKTGNLIFVVDEKGTLNVLKPELQVPSPRFDQIQKLSILDARSWTPPTILAEGLLLRGGKELAFVKFTTGESRIENSLEETKPLLLKVSVAKAENEIDPVDAIFQAFQSEGAEAALKVYAKLRQQQPSPLGVEERVTLFKAAKSQGLTDVADRILSDAEEDFPKSEEIRKLGEL